MSASTKIIQLPAVITIQRAAAVRQELLDQLEKADSFLVQLTDVEKIDIAGIQLLYALLNFAQSQNKEVNFSGSIPECMEIALLTGGFCSQIPAEVHTLGACLLGESYGG